MPGDQRRLEHFSAMCILKRRSGTITYDMHNYVTLVLISFLPRRLTTEEHQYVNLHRDLILLYYNSTGPGWLNIPPWLSRLADLFFGEARRLYSFRYFFVLLAHARKLEIKIFGAGIYVYTHRCIEKPLVIIRTAVRCVLNAYRLIGNDIFGLWSGGIVSVSVCAWVLILYRISCFTGSFVCV